VRPETVAALSKVVSLAALDDILRDAPIILILAFDMIGLAQRLQPTDVDVDGVRALALRSM
jgi:hypothetical protein